MKNLKYILLIAVFALAVNACKKIDEKDRRQYSNGNSNEIAKSVVTEASPILAKYSHHSPITDIYIVCVEGQKVGISDTGSLIPLSFVSGKGIQSCN